MIYNELRRNISVGDIVEVIYVRPVVNTRIGRVKEIGQKLFILEPTDDPIIKANNWLSIVYTVLIPIEHINEILILKKING